MVVTLKWMPYLHSNEILALLAATPYYYCAGGRHLSSSLHYREMFTVTGELCILCSHYVSVIAVTDAFNLVWLNRMICHIANSHCILTLVELKTKHKLIPIHAVTGLQFLLTPGSVVENIVLIFSMFF